jgi:hypothetical protein
MGFQAAIGMKCSGPVRLPERDPRPPILLHPTLLLSVWVGDTRCEAVKIFPVWGPEKWVSLVCGVQEAYQEGPRVGVAYTASLISISTLPSLDGGRE